MSNSEPKTKTYKVQLVTHFPDGVRHQGPVPGDMWVRAEERELELTDEQLKGYHDDQYFTVNGKATDAAKRLAKQQSSPAETRTIEESVTANIDAAAKSDAEGKAARAKADAEGARLAGQKEVSEDEQRELNARLKDGAVDAPTTANGGTEEATADQVQEGDPAADPVNHGPEDERGDADGSDDGDSEEGDAEDTTDDDTKAADEKAATIKDLKKNNNRDALVAQAKELGYDAVDTDEKDALAHKIVELKAAKAEA